LPADVVAGSRKLGEQVFRGFTLCVLQPCVDLPYQANGHEIAACLQLLVHLELRHRHRVVTEVVRLPGLSFADRHVGTTRRSEVRRR
jgi:hypothetical protein